MRVLVRIHALSLLTLGWAQVGSAGYSVKVEEKERLRLMFSFLPFRGRVKLRDPDHKFQVRAGRRLFSLVYRQ